MKMRRMTFVVFLCLVFCISLIPVSAFAGNTVVIIGGSLEQEAAVVTQGSTSASQSTVLIASNSRVADTILADNNAGNTIVAEQTESEPSSSVLVMPNGSVVKTQAEQSNTQTQAVQNAQQTTTASLSLMPTGLAYDIYQAVNAQRSAKGLGILGYDAQLQKTADLRAQESAVKFGHTRPDGSAAVTAVTVDYNVAGENLIQVTSTYASAKLLIETWMASETHKANIMLADFSQTAIGIYEFNGVTYVSQIFTD